MDQNFDGLDQGHRMLLIEELEQIVNQAALAGGTLQIGPLARRLGSSLSARGLSQRGIADELIRAAARAGVPIEIDTSE